jgi:hypothetical protein
LEEGLFRCYLTACLFRGSGWSGKAGKGPGLRLQDAPKERFGRSTSQFQKGLARAVKTESLASTMADPQDALQVAARFPPCPSYTLNPSPSGIVDCSCRPIA